MADFKLPPDLPNSADPAEIKKWGIATLEGLLTKCAQQKVEIKKISEEILKLENNLMTAYAKLMKEGR